MLTIRQNRPFTVAAAALALATGLCACSLVKAGPSEAAPDSARGSSAAEAAPPTLQAIPPGTSMLTAAAARIGATVTGEIKPGGPSNFFKFENPGKLRDIVVIRLENRSTTLRPDMKIYNADRSQLVEKYDGTPGAHVEQAISLDPGQAIYVEVLPYGSAGAYRLSAFAQKAYDVYEANDDQLRPTTLQFGDTIEASVMDDKDNDWYHVTAASSGKVTIALENLSATLRPDVKVYSAAKSQLIEKYDGTPGAGLDFAVELKAGQDFYVQVLPYGSKGAYRLSARPTVLADDLAGSLKARGAVALYGVYFDFDQSFVKPESVNTLAEVASLLSADPSLRLEIAGHTDGTGGKSHNLALSQARAQAVVAALAGQYGVDPGRLVAKGYGDSRPVATNDSASTRARNRRVELRRI